MADLVQTVDHALQDQKVKTEVLDRSAGRDRKDRKEDHVLLDQKVKTEGQDRSADRDQKDKIADHVLQDQKGKIVQTELLL